MNSDSAVQATEEQNSTSSSLLEFLGKHKWNDSFAPQMFVSDVAGSLVWELVTGCPINLVKT